jgi:hypothetical protein
MDSKDKEIQFYQTPTVEAGADKSLGVAGDVDEALRFLKNNVGGGETVHVDDKKLMRRVDWMLMPLMFACYYLQYTDKTLSVSVR